MNAADLLETRSGTLVMGVINVTPDSFYDGGAHFDTEAAVEHGLGLADEGADVLDVGGMSTRPGSEPVSVEEEMRRVLPVIELLVSKTDVPISVDTCRASVARSALSLGASMVNDVTAFSDPAILPLIAETEVAAIAMHMQGNPETMQANPHYDDVVEEVFGFLDGAVRRAEENGVLRSRVLVDPGIGFGKTDEHNLSLIRATPRLSELGAGVCLGASRKSFLGRLLDLPSEKRLEGSLAVAAYAIMTGARMLRSHDVAETIQVRTVLSAIDPAAA
jgi:dihydropteroate synthase